MYIYMPWALKVPYVSEALGTKNNIKMHVWR